ncbi:hypothetical protein TeGR_g14826 [Tetraparma gracilis]|uniref:Uncharacterized protein n=1 Tax=Tetraparma gracilis TaxID=2962635 RepID=A0ABQ6MX67_9STRA|nr:hypothetical protein TeGR_g14826 [Tetraparma gracilis]
MPPLLLLLLLLLVLLLPTSSFRSPPPPPLPSFLPSTPDLPTQLSEARQLLALARAKLASPGAARAPASPPDPSSLVKSCSPLGVVADTAAMLASSEAGEWTARSFGEIFKTELKEEKVFATRDDTLALLGLRGRLEGGDFDKIFDSRNPRIGEK